MTLKFNCTRFGGTYTKIGTIQRRLAWPLRKDDTQIREAFHIFYFPNLKTLFKSVIPFAGYRKRIDIRDSIIQ